MNEVRNNYGTSKQYTTSNSYNSGFFRDNNMFFSSSIGGNETLGPRKLQRSVVRKVPIRAGSGMVINDRASGKHDILECSKVTLSILEFKFHDDYENVINLHGCHVSFSLVFTTVVEDQCMLFGISILSIISSFFPANVFFFCHGFKTNSMENTNLY